MAQRYGGKYSPGGPPPGMDQSSATPKPNAFHGKRPTRAGARVNFLFLVPLLIGIKAFGQGPVGLALDLCALGLMLLSAWLTREGLLAEEAYEARKVARRPAIPRKIFGSVLMGAGLGLAGFVAPGGIVAPVVFAVLGAVLHFGAFGPDPMRDKGMEGIDSFQTDRVARAVEEAEKYLAAIHDAILRTQDRQLVTRVDTFLATARKMFRTIEDDPRDLTASRKYLGVYLMGMRDATVRFADLYARGHDAGPRKDYVALLDDLEANFTAQTQKLLADDRSDLDVQIDVLRERLQREGVSSV
ncbi:5-bromo-4-chloroindolyl phosphate hydrolysis family protein [Acidimangrovimonas sediminis]|uniref:5-bromo-4-chloroindolyl phosphate hydrolysis family protein n=1 Tax=Acidimangrovimonas sediminis TaxID=2056283 RepID=UPI000C7F9274|nr:5-bromo-4-chloroindolyl phosphate hydrolysis family protein [Acidimangrovimonas sediminis]